MKTLNIKTALIFLIPAIAAAFVILAVTHLVHNPADFYRLIH